MFVYAAQMLKAVVACHQSVHLACNVQTMWLFLLMLYVTPANHRQDAFMETALQKIENVLRKHSFNWSYLIHPITAVKRLFSSASCLFSFLLSKAFTKPCIHSH